MRKNPHVRICGGLGSATTLVYPTTRWPEERREDASPPSIPRSAGLRSLRWLSFAGSRPRRSRPALHAGLWRDPRGRGCAVDPAPAEESQSQRLCERFVRSIKEECLSRVVPLGEGHLRLLVREYVEHPCPLGTPPIVK